MIKELKFETDRKLIEEFRLDSYRGALAKGSDEFDEAAHHFALFDSAGQMLALARVLRSDEVSSFELFRESRLKMPELPPARLSLEASRVCAAHGSSGVHLLKLCMGINEYAVENKADYLIAKTVEKFLPIYKRMGFTVFAPPFTSDFFDDNRTVYPIVYQWNKGAPDDDDVMIW
jgi:hypothetical protein